MAPLDARARSTHAAWHAASINEHQDLHCIQSKISIVGLVACAHALTQHVDGRRDEVLVCFHVDDVVDGFEEHGMRGIVAAVDAILSPKRSASSGASGNLQDPKQAGSVRRAAEEQEGGGVWLFSGI